jgi:hypothetical protein
VLRLHVSDDQGFRIAINGRPELTAIGVQFSINNDPGGFWCQAEYVDVVNYAAAHFTTVIPEVDTPGHTNAIVMSYAGSQADPVLPDVNCTNRTPPQWNMTTVVGWSPQTHPDRDLRLLRQPPGRSRRPVAAKERSQARSPRSPRRGRRSTGVTGP